MDRVFQYYGRFQGLRGRVTSLPAWARFVVLIAALPGIALVALSILAFLVSLLALLLLTLPVYRLLQAITGATGRPGETGNPAPEDFDSPGRKRIDATVIE